MKGTISNIIGVDKKRDLLNLPSLEFTLNLEKSGASDEEIDFLRKNLESLISGDNRNKSTFYVSNITIINEGVSFTLVEQKKVLLVGRYCRDNEFIALVIKGKPENVPGGYNGKY